MPKIRLTWTGLAKKLVEQLVDQKLVKSFADLFHLDRETLAGLERMGLKASSYPFIKNT